MRGVITDKASPLVYGYTEKEMPVYFASSPVISVGRTGAGEFGYFNPNAPGARIMLNLTPNAVPVKISPWDAEQKPEESKGDEPDSGSPFGSAPPTSRTGGAEPTQHPRVVMQFPAKADDILLSGMLSGGQALTKKALLVDVPDGKGHMVLFGLRPFWRWQTQGTYFLGFNAILNWDHLDVGTPPPKKAEGDAAATPAPAAGSKGTKK
jgi:hypothetical protein